MKKVENFIINNADWIGRIALFLTYFWFGALKLLGTSPAEDLVIELQSMTLSFIPSDTFMIILGVSEMLIGIAFLIPKITKYIFLIFLGHMFTTMLPLIFLPDITWHSFPSLTLEGQYIVKNVVLIGLAWGVTANYLKRESRFPKVEQPVQVPQK